MYSKIGLQHVKSTQIAYSQDKALSDYHLFETMGHGPEFRKKNSLMNGSQQKGNTFTSMVTVNCPKVGQNM